MQFGKTFVLALTLVSSAAASLTTGTVTLDGTVIHYQAYSGNDEAVFQAFLQGAKLVDFETVPGTTAKAVNSYNSSTTTASNLIDPTVALNGAFISAGGQTPGNPANGGNPGALLDVSGIANGAHSGKNVFGPTAQGDPTEPLDFNGFVSADFPLNQPISRFGWWTNPNGGKVNFAPHLNTFDASNNMVDLSAGITFSANPGDFVAFAFDKSVLNEVELFQTGPMTLDDFTYARDNALPLAGGSAAPEPASLTLSILSIAIAVPALLRRRRRQILDCIAG